METFSSKEILYLSLKFSMVGGKVRVFRIDSNEYPLSVCLSLENELTVSDEDMSRYTGRRFSDEKRSAAVGTG